MKKYCPTHHFYYTGEECPFCRQERIQKLDKRFNKKPVVEKESDADKEITMDDIQKLKDKFGC